MELGAAFVFHIKKVNIVQWFVLKVIYGYGVLFPTEKIQQVAEVLNIQQLYFMRVAQIKTNKKLVQSIEHSYYTRHKSVGYRVDCAEKIISQGSWLY